MRRWQHRHLVVRIIPARAGFTLGGVVASTTSADHPRSRRVYSTVKSGRMTIEGSSPLARGLPRACEPSDPRRRIIPARAGFTTGLRAIGPTTSDHPRSRGVYRRCSCFARGGVGSSPLARGLHGARGRPRGPPGIIPARTGFTESGAADGDTAGDHPRSRGVYLRPLIHRQEQVRIIPARAGFTDAERGLSVRRWDHPRSRGVYMAGERVDIDARGSSPLARGLPRLAVLLQRPAGIIPARAGFTAGITGKTWVNGDHPRSRGVYVCVASGLTRPSGSSPLARGLRRSSIVIEHGPGIIPARAGFTG